MEGNIMYVVHENHGWDSRGVVGIATTRDNIKEVLGKGFKDIFTSLFYDTRHYTEDATEFVEESYRANKETIDGYARVLKDKGSLILTEEDIPFEVTGLYYYVFELEEVRTII